MNLKRKDEIMSAYTVEQQIDVKEAFDEMEAIDRQDFIKEAIGDLDYSDRSDVVREAFFFLDEPQLRSLAVTIFYCLSPNDTLSMVQDLTDELTEAQRKKLIKYMED